MLDRIIENIKKEIAKAATEGKTTIEISTEDAVSLAFILPKLKELVDTANNR